MTTVEQAILNMSRCAARDDCSVCPYFSKPCCVQLLLRDSVDSMEEYIASRPQYSAEYDALLKMYNRVENERDTYQKLLFRLLYRVTERGGGK